MKKNIFKACVLLLIVSVMSFGFAVSASAQTQWGEYKSVPTDMFWDNTGDWQWDGNQYTAFHEPGVTDSGNFISWTDFGTGLGEDLTNYKIRFKSTLPADGQGTPGFSLAATNIGENVFGQAPYQAIAKGFGLPIWYFGDWMGRPGGNTVSWSNLGNPAAGDELLFEIMVSPEKFTFSINGYVIEDLDNPPNQGKGYFGLGGQHIEESPSTGVVFYDIQYALPYEESSSEEAPGTEEPATEAPATEAPGTEAPSTEAPSTEAPGDFSAVTLFAISSAASLGAIAISKKKK